MENLRHMRRLLYSTPVLGIALQPLYFTLAIIASELASLQEEEIANHPSGNQSFCYLVAQNAVRRLIHANSTFTASPLGLTKWKKPVAI